PRDRAVSRRRVSLSWTAIPGAIRSSSLTIRSLGLGSLLRSPADFGAYFTSLRGPMRGPPPRVTSRVGDALALHGEILTSFRFAPYRRRSAGRWSVLPPARRPSAGRCRAGGCLIGSKDPAGRLSLFRIDPSLSGQSAQSSPI